MKIYEIGTGYTPIPARMGAATEIVVEELTRSLINNGFSAEIIDIKAREREGCNLPITPVWVPRMFTKTDVSLGIMHKLKRVVYSVSLARKLKKILKKEKEQVVFHFHNQYNLYFFYKLVSKKLASKAKIVYTVHSYIWHGKWDEIEETVKKRYFQEAYCLERADHVFVLNDITRDNIINNLKVPHERVHLIDNGVNTEVYKPLSKEERNAIKEEKGLSGKTVYLQIGSVCDRKNQLTSVRLLAPIMKENPNVMFLYAGGIISEEYQQSIITYAESKGISDRVKYLGELTPGKELNNLYNTACGMVFPSKAEGFSLVIIEAMSAGLPVFVSEGLDFKLKDACVKFSCEADFATKLQQIAGGAFDANKQRDLVMKMYSWDKIAADYISVIEQESING